jgi:hypothetical protein
MDPVLKEDRAFTKEELDEMVEAAREFLPADLRI